MNWGAARGTAASGESGRPQSTAGVGPLALATREGRWVDLVVLASVPALLLGVYGLPAPVRRGLVLSYVDPTPVAALASHFVHLAPEHLGANLGVYTVVVPVTYLLCALGGRRLEFLLAFTVYLLAFPVVLSALNVALVRPRVGYGFSGINTAFFGLLPIALTWYLRGGLGVPIEARDAPALFFGSTTVIALVAVPATAASLAIGLVGLLATAGYLLAAAGRATAIRRRLVTVWSTRPGYVELAAVGLVTVAAFPIAAFPADPAGAGRVLNLYAHLLGYTLSFIAAYVSFGLVELEYPG